MPACPNCCLRGGQAAAPEQAFLKNGFPIAKCLQCGLLWTCTEPDYDPNPIYTENYFQGGVSDGYFDYTGSEGLLRREYEARLRIIRRYQPDGNLFEIGCATGGFLRHAERYYTAAGVDVSKFAVDIALKKGLNVSLGSFEDLHVQDSTQDVIVMFDTIEHLKDPVRTLRAVHDALRPGGTLCLTTGDAQSLSARAMGARWRLLTPPQHLWFFGAENLSGMLAALGFKCLLLRHPWRFVPLSLMWYQAFRGRARPLPAVAKPLAFPVNLFDSMFLVARRGA